MRILTALKNAAVKTVRAVGFLCMGITSILLIAGIALVLWDKTLAMIGFFVYPLAIIPGAIGFLLLLMSGYFSEERFPIPHQQRRPTWPLELAT